jgi:hypothetical protein
MKPNERRGGFEHIKPLVLAILLGIAGGLIQGYAFSSWSPWNQSRLIVFFLLLLFIISPCIPVIGGSALKLPIAYLALAVFISEFSVVPFCDVFWHLTKEMELFEMKMLPSYLYLLLWAGFLLTVEGNRIAKIFSYLFFVAFLLCYAYTFRCIKRGIRNREDLIFAVLILLLI